MALGDLFAHKQFNENIVTVLIDEETENALYRKYTSSNLVDWRKDHAVVVDRLSEAGAKVIVFDVTFKESLDSAVDLALREAMLRAKERDTSVIVGVKQFEHGDPNLMEELETDSIGWGAITIGDRGYTKLAPLLIYKAPAVEPVVGLALRAFAAYHGANEVDVVDFDPNEKQITIRLDSETQPVNKKLSFFETDVMPQIRRRAGAPTKGDVVANLGIDLTRVKRIREESRRYAYQDIRNSTDPDKLAQVKDKIVVVGIGIERLSDVHGDRWGFELQADAINTLLNGVTIQLVAPRDQCILMVILGILGVAIRIRTMRVSRRQGFLLLMTVLLAYFAGTICLYVRYRYLLNILYHVVTLFLGYWIVGKLERRYFRVTV